MIDQVNSMIRARQRRADYFRSLLFTDLAWDILLDLTRAELVGERATVSSVCVAAAVAPSTALRWIDVLAEEGLLAKRNDILDRRRVFVALTDAGASAMQAYLNSAEPRSTRF